MSGEGQVKGREEKGWEGMGWVAGFSFELRLRFDLRMGKEEEAESY